MEDTSSPEPQQLDDGSDGAAEPRVRSASEDLNENEGAEAKGEREGSEGAGIKNTNKKLSEKKLKRLKDEYERKGMHWLPAATLYRSFVGVHAWQNFVVSFYSNFQVLTRACCVTGVIYISRIPPHMVRALYPTLNLVPGSYIYSQSVV